MRKKYFGSLITALIMVITACGSSDSSGTDSTEAAVPPALTGLDAWFESVRSAHEGEKVVLFIRSIENRYWGMNLGFGTYKVINYGNETVLVNYIFPLHPTVGQIGIQDFEKLVKKIKGNNLKIVRTLEYPTTPDQSVVQRVPASGTDGQNRTLASKSEQLDNQEDQSSLNVLWLIVALGFIGGLFRMSSRKAYK